MAIQGHDVDTHRKPVILTDILSRTVLELSQIIIKSLDARWPRCVLSQPWELRGCLEAA